MSRTLAPRACRYPCPAVSSRAFTGYTKEQTKQLFGGIAITIPACCMWYYFRMNIVQPYLDERDEAKAVAKKESELSNIAAEYELKAKSAAKSAAALLSPNTIYIDVRSAEEISALRLPRLCLHIPCTVKDASLIRANASKLPADRTATIVVFCRSGMRAARALTTLERMGYTNVINGGGAQDLIDAIPKEAASAVIETVANNTAAPRKKWLGLI